jgi:hypothetical protein
MPSIHRHDKHLVRRAPRRVPIRIRQGIKDIFFVFFTEEKILKKLRRFSFRHTRLHDYDIGIIPIPNQG